MLAHVTDENVGIIFWEHSVYWYLDSGYNNKMCFTLLLTGDIFVSHL